MKTLFEEIVGVSPETTILQLFIEGRGLPYSFKDIMENINLYQEDAELVFKRFIKKKILIPSVHVNEEQLFKINEKSKLAYPLIELFDNILNEELKNDFS